MNAEAAYLFRHALLRVAAYRSTRNQRKCADLREACAKAGVRPFDEPPA